MRKLLYIAFFLALILLFALDYWVNDYQMHNMVQEALNHQNRSELLAEEFRTASEDLNRAAQRYVATRNEAFYNEYFYVLAWYRGDARRPKNVNPNLFPNKKISQRAIMKDHLHFNETQLKYADRAIALSTQLAEIEMQAMETLRTREIVEDGPVKPKEGETHRSFARRLVLDENCPERNYHEATAAIMAEVDHLQKETGQVAQKKINDINRQAFFYSLVINLFTLIFTFLFIYLLIRDLRLLLAKLQRSDAVAKRAQRIAKMASWVFSLSSNTFIYSEGLYDVCGQRSETNELSFEKFKSIVHPDDIEKVLLAWEDAIAKSKPCEITFRIIHSNNTTRHIRMLAEPKKEGLSGKVREFVGFSQDITEREIREIELIQHQSYLTEVQKTAKIGMFVMDPATGDVAGSNSSKEIYGNPDDVYTRDSIEPNVHPDDRAARREALARLESKRELVSYTCRLLPSETHPREKWLYVSIWPQDPDDEKSFFIGFIQDITEIKSLETQLIQNERALSEMTNRGKISQWKYFPASGRIAFTDNFEDVEKIYRKPELTQEEMSNIVHPDEILLCHTMFSECVENGTPFEIVHKTARDPQVRSYIKGWRQTGATGECEIAGFAQDISEVFKKSEEESRLHNELEIAREIQGGLLPKPIPVLEVGLGLDIFSHMLPAREVGGDLYDFAIVGDKLYVLVGDVSDKGVAASLIMAMCKSLMRSHIVRLQDPAAAFEVVSREIERGNERCMFVTAFCGLLDLKTNEFTYCNAGHAPPVLVRDDKASFLDLANSPGLGMDAKATYQNSILHFNDTDRLVLYTDGITEAMDQNHNLFGEKKLLAVLEENSGTNICKQMIAILREVKDYAGQQEQSDDIALLALSNRSADYVLEKSKIIARILLKNDFSEVRRLGCEVKKLAEKYDWLKEFTGYVNLVIEEWVVNIITYGKTQIYPLAIDIKLFLEKDLLRIQITDNTSPFDPTRESREPDLEVPLEEREIGGLGLMMIKQVTQSFEYEYIQEENTVTMTLALPEVS